MPDFTTTEATLAALEAQIDTELGTHKVTKDFSPDQYQFVVDSSLVSGKLKIRFSLKSSLSTDVNKIPWNVMKRYLECVRRVRQWKQGKLPDFPTFTDV